MDKVYLISGDVYSTLWLINGVSTDRINSCFSDRDILLNGTTTYANSKLWLSFKAALTAASAVSTVINSTVLVDADVCTMIINSRLQLFAVLAVRLLHVLKE